jgi:Uma2 family endonuclease
MSVGLPKRKKSSVGLQTSKKSTNERLLIAADLPYFPEKLSCGTVRYELDKGRLIIMAPPGDIHGAAQLNLAAELKFQGERRGHGKARTEVGVILWRDPDTVYGPDAVFVASASLPLELSKEGYLETIPDLVIEVRSKNDTDAEIAAKVKDYRKAGVRVIWVANPATETVTEYRKGKKPRVFKGADTLTLEDVIPGFQMPLAEVFRL